MDFILGIALILSLIFNGGQAIDNIKDEKKIEKQSTYIAVIENDNKTLKESSEANLLAYKEALNQNDKYDDIVDDLERRIENCNSDLRKQIDKINNWKDSDRLKQIAIENLKREIDSRGDMPSCRVPAWVDFEAGKN